MNKIAIILLTLLSFSKVQSQEWFDVNIDLELYNFKSMTDLENVNFYILNVNDKIIKPALEFDSEKKQLKISYMTMGGGILFIIEKGYDKTMIMLDDLSNIDKSATPKDGVYKTSPIKGSVNTGYYTINDLQLTRAENPKLCDWLYYRTLTNLQLQHTPKQ